MSFATPKLYDPTTQKLSRMFALRARSLNENLHRLVPDYEKMCSTPFRRRNSTYHGQREAMVKAWHDYLGSLEAIPFGGARPLVFDPRLVGDSLCLWDGERPTPADKDSYSHFIVPNLYLGEPYMLVPKELALKMLVLGSAP